MLSYTALVFDPSPASTLGRRNPATTTASHLQPPCNSPFLLCREDPKVLLALEMFRVFPIPSPLLPNPQRELKSSLIFNSALFSFLSCVATEMVFLYRLFCYFFCILLHASLEHRCSEHKSHPPSHRADLGPHPAPAYSVQSCVMVRSQLQSPLGIV